MFIKATLDYIIDYRLVFVTDKVIANLTGLIPVKHARKELSLFGHIARLATDILVH